MEVNIVNRAALKVAICVCTISRPDELMKLISNLRAIDLGDYDPANVQLIVIDNKLGTNTREFCEQAATTMPIAVHYTCEPESGITYARNHALSVALERGADVVAFLDDDDEPHPDWLIRLLDRYLDSGADLVFGTWILDPNMPEWARKTGIFRSPSKVKKENKIRRYGLPNFASTCNVLVGKDIIEKVGSSGPVFSHDFRYSGGEDKDFFLRALERGAHVTTAEASIIQRNHEPARYTVKGLLKRGFKNGCSQVNMVRTHGTVGRQIKLTLTSLLKFLVMLVILPFSVFSRGRFMHSLYRIAKSSGIVFSSLTGRSINYYSRQ
ncbi:MAG: glycosyltransferase family 2 protein [Halioglobus sp.]